MQQFHQVNVLRVPVPEGNRLIRKAYRTLDDSPAASTTDLICCGPCLLSNGASQVVAIMKDGSTCIMQLMGGGGHLA